MKYCTLCVLPETKPDLWFDENGVCSACLNYQEREHIDWHQRKNQLDDILKQYRSQNGYWDCIVPVSGGKDSTFQVLTLLHLGMHPLCVNASTCDLSPLGRANLENLKNLGVDCIEFSTNKKVRKQLNRIGLQEVGDISWPEHASIFTIPVQMAVRYQIPLIIWGENSQNEYGGPVVDSQKPILDRKWLEKFGGLLNLQVEQLSSKYDIAARDLLPYQYPTDQALAAVGVTGLFIGHYLPWDGYTNALQAQAYGMQTFHRMVEGSIVNYENLDNFQTGIHDYFKFLKFGFGRASDLASLHIRRKRLSRQQAIELIALHDGKFPHHYLDKPLIDILKPLDLTVEEFIKICDKFTNKQLFQTDAQGNIVKDKMGNVIKLYFEDIHLVNRIDKLSYIYA